MEMQNETENEPVVEELEPVKKKMGRPRIHPIKPAKDKKLSLYLEDRKAYFRQYYSVRTKTIHICPVCESEFSCKSSYIVHARCNKNCIILRLQQQLDSRCRDAAGHQLSCNDEEA